jgi:hypothetical protein
MVNTYGEESRSVVVGSSVHNQRIERHNRAVNEQVISAFKLQFYELESQGILDPSNSTDLYCLHFIFLPRLNRSISEFIAAHNHHVVSTEENRSPLQLFYQYRHLTTLQYQGVQERAQGMSVRQLLETRDLPHVELSDVENPLDNNRLQALVRTVDPLSAENGKWLYQRAIEFVGNHLLSNTSNDD